MKCQNCHKREGTETWVGDGGILGFVHGAYQMWCKQCIEKAQKLNKSKKDVKKDNKPSSKLTYYPKPRYYFTRQEILQWLTEQNWKCKELEDLLNKKK